MCRVRCVRCNSECVIVSVRSVVCGQCELVCEVLVCVE